MDKHIGQKRRNNNDVEEEIKKEQINSDEALLFPPLPVVN